MLERLRNAIGERLCDIFSVAGVNGLALGVIHLADIKLAAELLLILLTVAHTIWRWKREAKRLDKTGDE